MRPLEGLYMQLPCKGENKGNSSTWKRPTETEANDGTWARGKLQGLQEAAMNILEVRFPILAAIPQAQQAVASIQDTDTLEQLFEQLLRVPDEQTARIVLDLPSE